jgi:hypothetical protein
MKLAFAGDSEMLVAPSTGSIADRTLSGTQDKAQALPIVS